MRAKHAQGLERIEGMEEALTKREAQTSTRVTSNESGSIGRTVHKRKPTKPTQNPRQGRKKKQKKPKSRTSPPSLETDRAPPKRVKAGWLREKEKSGAPWGRGALRT